MNIHAIYGALSPHLRRGRMRQFQDRISPRAGETLLDVGGTPWIWADPTLASGVRITLLNRLPPSAGPVNRTGREFACATGDGCALPYADGAFDIVFSNSVIEHVGTWERQQAFAREARRVGRRLWVQTPAREFFIEPHLIAPCVHWLPRAAQRRVLRRGTVRGWLDRWTTADVDAFLNEVRLISRAEMQALFPDCTILRERFCGMVKSHIALRTT